MFAAARVYILVCVVSCILVARIPVRVLIFTASYEEMFPHKYFMYIFRIFPLPLGLPHIPYPLPLHVHRFNRSPASCAFVPLSHTLASPSQATPALHLRLASTSAISQQFHPLFAQFPPAMPPDPRLPPPIHS